MYIHKPSVTKTEAANRVNFSIVLAAGLNSTKPGQMLVYLPDMRQICAIS